MGVTLPEDYKALLRLANGQLGQDTEPLTFPPDGLTFLSIDDVVREWNEQAAYYDDEASEEPEFQERVRYVLYHPGRIPVAANVSATKYLFIDYVPGPTGHAGQLVVNRDEFECEVVAESLTDLPGPLCVRAGERRGPRGAEAGGDGFGLLVHIGRQAHRLRPVPAADAPGSWENHVR